MLSSPLHTRNSTQALCTPRFPTAGAAKFTVQARVVPTALAWATGRLKTSYARLERRGVEWRLIIWPDAIKRCMR